LVIFGVQEGVLLKRGAWKSKIESPTASILWLSPLGMPFLTFIGQQYLAIQNDVLQSTLLISKSLPVRITPNGNLLLLSQIAQNQKNAEELLNS
ncbi:MAG: hypothetical protein SOX65_05900, partial [Porphyromonas sp.]|uniref:hypothetical protein n=1 Tax=Porphyromonas sp. TaxID=1924944 RepID=UPI002A7ED357